MLRLFGFAGLYVFIAMVIVAANIEVLKVVKFSVLSNPVALGTVFFASAFWATDILTEYYGAHIARLGILAGFAGSILLLGCVILGLGFKPITHLQAMQIHLTNETQIQTSLINIFTPMVSVLGASLASYLTSQFTDVWIFKTVRRITKKRFLWLRSNLSTILSALLDSIVFNLLAWKILTLHPVTWHTLFYTYFLATYLIRIFIAALGTPAIYLAGYILPKQSNVAWENL